MREQVERLEHHADVGPQLRQLAALLGQHLTVDRDRAGVDGLEPIDGAAQRRLARARRPEHDDHLPAVDVEVDVLEHMQAAEVLVDALYPRSSARLTESNRPAFTSDPVVSMGADITQGTSSLPGTRESTQIAARTLRTMGP